jgi:hypothetical protein
VAHLSRVLQMLSGVNAAVVRIADREMLLALFCERVGRALGIPDNGQPRVAVIVFDIAHLSTLNDACGRPSLAACLPTRRAARWCRPSSRWHVPLI